MNKTIPIKIYKLLGAERLGEIYRCHTFHATESSLEFCIYSEEINFVKIQHDAETDLFDISFRLYDYFGVEVIIEYIDVHSTYLKETVLDTIWFN